MGRWVVPYELGTVERLGNKVTKTILSHVGGEDSIIVTYSVNKHPWFWWLAKKIVGHTPMMIICKGGSNHVKIIINNVNRYAMTEPQLIQEYTDRHLSHIILDHLAELAK